MKEYAKSKAKRVDRLLFGKPCNDEGHSNEAAEQKFETLHPETSTRRKKLEEQLEIVQVPVNNVTKFESEKLFGLLIDGNKRKTLSQSETPISWQYFATRIATRDTAQEREENLSLSNDKSSPINLNESNLIKT